MKPAPQRHLLLGDSERTVRVRSTIRPQVPQVLMDGDLLVRYHHQCDNLKSTRTSDGEEPESLPSHPEFIGLVSFAFLQDF
jgi:hypothetical protein